MSGHHVDFDLFDWILLWLTLSMIGGYLASGKLTVTVRHVYVDSAAVHGDRLREGGNE